MTYKTLSVYLLCMRAYYTWFPRPLRDKSLTEIHGVFELRDVLINTHDTVNWCTVFDCAGAGVQHDDEDDVNVLEQIGRRVSSPLEPEPDMFLAGRAPAWVGAPKTAVRPPPPQKVRHAV